MKWLDFILTNQSFSKTDRTIEYANELNSSAKRLKISTNFEILSFNLIL